MKCFSLQLLLFCQRAPTTWNYRPISLLDGLHMRIFQVVSIKNNKQMEIASQPYLSLFFLIGGNKHVISFLRIFLKIYLFKWWKLWRLQNVLTFSVGIFFGSELSKKWRISHIIVKEFWSKNLKCHSCKLWKGLGPKFKIGDPPVVL